MSRRREAAQPARSEAEASEVEEMDDLNGRIAVVTGGGSGIGRGLSLGLAARGLDQLHDGRICRPEQHVHRSRGLGSEKHAWQHGWKDPSLEVRGMEPRRGERPLQLLDLHRDSDVSQLGLDEDRGPYVTARSQRREAKLSRL